MIPKVLRLVGVIVLLPEPGGYGIVEEIEEQAGGT